MPKVIISVIVVVIALVAGGIAGVAIASSPNSIFGVISSGDPIVDTETESRTTLAVKSLERSQEVVVLQIGMVGIKDSTQIGTVFGVEVPGSERAVFLRYEFDAKLGFNGEDVQIEAVDDTTVRVTIPEFVFIGFDNWNTELAAETNGVLSWTTPEIDQLAMSNGILTDDAQQQILDDYTDLLTDQAKVFYTQIVTAIDPTIELEFMFASSPGAAE